MSKLSLPSDTQKLPTDTVQSRPRQGLVGTTL